MQRLLYLTFVTGLLIVSSLFIVACAALDAKPTLQPTAALPTLVSPTMTLPTTAPPAVSPTDMPTNNTFTLGLDPIATGLNRPVFVADAGDDSGRLFLVEQPGRILILENGKVNPTPFLDVADLITTAGNEQGLLGLAFHPDYKNNGLFFINYSAAANGDNIIARYRVSDDPNVAEANSGQVILTIPGAESNHNGGMLSFGPDGYLYVGTGDGGGAGDRHGAIGNGQALDTLLGKILRIDVNADTFTVPSDNPFVNTPGARPEIWTFGWRNLWRFSFDRETGDLFVGDVGQNSVEEISFQPAGEGGGNYGWRIMEGDECFDPNLDCSNPDLIAPIATYSHDLGCSVTGGYMYRGQNYPWLVGQYIFADYCSGNVWATARDADGAWHTRLVTTFDDTISSFGEDSHGELYVAGHRDGTIFKLTSTE
ncbi:MAG: PQQ-dependent sugar dehydrogenase [Anaerolineae bacterium]|nr:PQQ-dependent sugar dehydrogenase [Anaerolineae bacterium]